MQLPPTTAHHRRHLGLLVVALCLGGCVSALPPATTTAPEPERHQHTADTVAVVTTVDNQGLNELQKQVRYLQQQLDELQRQQTALSQLLSAQGTVSGTPAPTASSNQWQQAQQQYRAGLYAQTVHTLAGADSGGDGSSEAQERMYLLLQAHWRLQNCESVINIGNRFAGRFARHPQAPEALWLVGQCQWRMQQQDITRSTWRKIIQTYPDSAASKRAWQHLQKHQ